MGSKKKGGKGQGHMKKAVNPILARKEKRKEERKQKKKMKSLHLQKKFGKVEQVQEIQTNKDKREEKAKKSKEEKKLKLEKEQKRQRKRRLLEANKEEEKTLKKLEKQLKFKKKKKGSLPKAFMEDGLDFLLDVCDEEKLELMKGENAEEDSEVEEEEEGSDQEMSGMEEELNGMEEEEEEDSEEEGQEEELEEADELGEEEEEEEEDGEVSEEGEEDSNAEEEKNEDKVWEDIYGRTRDAKGNVIAQGSTSSASTSAPSAPGKYIPPAMRAKMVGTEDEKRKLMLERLQKRVKGLLNRLASTNMAGIARELEDAYGSHSRNDMSECLFKLISESLISPVLSPERLVMEHALLISLLHVNVGQEVGATLLQSFVESFHQRYLEYTHSEENSKELDNAMMLISHFYTFKIVDSVILFDLLDLMAKSFEAKDIEVILMVLKAVGFSLRKDNPSRLKDLILSLQAKSGETKDSVSDSRVKFMLEILLAIKNNNVKKIPNYDTEHQQFLQKSMKQWFRPGCSSNPLKVNLKDLLDANKRGRWWIVGGAWEGKEDSDPVAPTDTVPSFSSELLDKAREMRMNNDARKNIFCSVMSAEDYLDAFEKIVKLPVKNQKEREVAFVLIDCCLQERSFNPYYAQLCCKLAEFDRKYRMAVQFAMWDKIKERESLRKFQLNSLALFASFVIREEALSLASLKVIEFADLNKLTVSFLKTLLASLLKEEEDKCASLFRTIADPPKLKTLREGLRLFLKHFLLKDKKLKDQVSKSKIGVAERALMSGERYQGL